MLTPADRRRLRIWFNQHQRALPWRESRDPYRIWVSEVMLQQTTVSTVIPRFQQFLVQFPSLESLAIATEQAVLKAWEGLGYYSRARNLHRAAKQLVAQFGQDIPDDPEIWAELPGVGRYILGAVLSQAFERRLPIVEANTKRVYARLASIQEDLSSNAIQARLWQIATDILPQKEVGNFNQALMELGATVCTIKNPNCGQCPLNRSCTAFRSGIQDQIPKLQQKAKFEKVREVCWVICSADYLFLRQRSATGRWANMWEFPTFELADHETPFNVGKRLLKELKIQGTIGLSLPTRRYTVTRFRVEMYCVEVHVENVSTPENPQERWIKLSELSQYPIRSSQRKLAESLLNPIQRELFSS